MYAPHVFHGIRADVTVPESSTARESTCGASPRRANSSRYIRAGRTSATYWSPAIMLRPSPLAFTARISFPRESARATIGAMMRRRKPACSITAPKDSAPRISQIVVKNPAIPPRENSVSIASFPVLLTNPVAIAA